MNPTRSSSPDSEVDSPIEPRGLPSAASPVDRAGAGRSIPSLDGLRTISIALVLIAHLERMPSIKSMPRSIENVGSLGVRVFFVISGFLITTLLVQELETRRAIDLSRFYLRRTLRIFPAYYVFLTFVTIGTGAGLLDLPIGRMWPAWAYLSNYFDPHSWIVGHTWSLSVEEQFYLVWPITLALVGRNRGWRVAIAVIVAAPLLRCLLFLATREGNVATQFNFDFLAAGCLLALVWPRVAAAAIWKRRSTGAIVAIAATAVVAIHLKFEGQIRWMFVAEMVFVQPFEVVSLTAIIAWCVIRSDTIVGRFLNLAGMRLLGVLSYSLYLWQQLFFGPQVSISPLTALLATLGAGVASYVLVERPLLGLRRRLSGSRSRLDARAA